jgi:amino-acid N-acetyltransferase
MDIHIGPATPNDFQDIISLLWANQLPTKDIRDPTVKLFKATVNGKLAGTIGIEEYGSLALLRSLAVDDLFKDQGVGRQLLHYHLEFCRDNGVLQLYLLTTTAENYFKKYGFVKMDRQLVPEAISGTKEFLEICPASATVMHLDMQS